MAQVTIGQLPPASAADNADESPIFQGGVTKKATMAQVRAGLARLSGDNTLAGNQTIQNAQGTILVTGTSIAINNATGAARGPFLAIGKNSDSAPGVLALTSGAGDPANNFVWADDSGNLRIKTGYSTEFPTSANKNSTGTAVGAQTSHESMKHLSGDVLPIADVLAAITAAAQYVARFTYLADDAVWGDAAEVYEGLVLREDAPETHRYGTDKHELSAGKSLNTITVIGDLLRAMGHVIGRLDALQKSIDMLHVDADSLPPEMTTSEP